MEDGTEIGHCHGLVSGSDPMTGGRTMRMCWYRWDRSDDWMVFVLRATSAAELAELRRQEMCGLGTVRVLEETDGVPIPRPLREET